MSHKPLNVMLLPIIQSLAQHNHSYTWWHISITPNLNLNLILQLEVTVLLFGISKIVL